MNKSCFVIMPIGEVILPDKHIAKAELRARYDDLIKEAILRARPDLDVVRADDVSAPGGITTDIFMRLMHSDYVVADISFPNPNVFYELGIRHACRPGTLLLRERGGPQTPSDVAGLRYVEYENTPTGLKTLSSDLAERFKWIDLHQGEPDNDFLSIAKLTAYRFQSYQKKEEQDAAAFHVFYEMAQHPEIIELLTAQAGGQPLDQQELIKRIAAKPELFRALMFFLIKSGQLKP